MHHRPLQSQNRVQLEIEQSTGRVLSPASEIRHPPVSLRRGAEIERVVTTEARTGEAAEVDEVVAVRVRGSGAEIIDLRARNRLAREGVGHPPVLRIAS